MTFLPLFSIPDALGTSGLGFLLVLIVLAVIMLFVRLLSKILGGKSKKENKEETVTEAQSPAPAQSTQTGTVIAEEPAKVNISAFIELYITFATSIRFTGSLKLSEVLSKIPNIFATSIYPSG